MSKYSTHSRELAHETKENAGMCSGALRDYNAKQPGVEATDNNFYQGALGRLDGETLKFYDNAFTFDADAAFRAEFERRFPSLSYEFIKTMDEIGKLGRDKYGNDAIEARIKRGDRSRPMERIHRREIQRNSADHFSQYVDGIRHDVYNTGRHQLAAAAFNPMMEFMLSGLEKEGLK